MAGTASFTFTSAYPTARSPSWKPSLLPMRISPRAPSRSSLFRIYALTSNDIKVGTNIVVDGAPWRVLEFLHVKPGKGAAFVRTKIRNYVTGNTVDKTFRAGSGLEEANVFKEAKQFTYKDGAQYVFMDLISPSPSPDLVHTKSNTTSSNTSSNNTKVESSSKGSNLTLTAPPPLNDEKNGGKTNPKTDSRSDVGVNCTGFPRRCSDGNGLVACILNFEHRKVVVLAQNEGESNIHIDLSAPDPADSASFELPKHKRRQITLLSGSSNEVILKSGYGECVLHLDFPTSKGNYFMYLPSYDKLVTPINGAYFLIVTVLIFGGMSICCLFGRKTRQDGIPYQELEMGLPESSLSNTVETAEGWDKGWDEENAVKSPSSHHTGNISANGLTSRTPKKDEWENDWDD